MEYIPLSEYFEGMPEVLRKYQIAVWNYGYPEADCLCKKEVYGIKTYKKALDNWEKSGKRVRQNINDILRGERYIKRRRVC